jgi:hypothetical protein
MLVGEAGVENNSSCFLLDFGWMNRFRNLSGKNTQDSCYYIVEHENENFGK